jgi:hypothetical protein
VQAAAIPPLSPDMESHANNFPVSARRELSGGDPRLRGRRSVAAATAGGPRPQGAAAHRRRSKGSRGGEKACEDFFKADVADAVFADPIAWDNGCLAAAPVSVTAIKLKNGKRVALKPAALLRCPMALSVAEWVRDKWEPAARKLGTDVERIDVAASYSCRPRNGVFGAILSEHGKANALDIRAIHFTSGATVTIEKAQGPREFLSAIRKSACERFMTVLGPGSDKPHETHLHVDLQQRRNNYKICQWILPHPDGATSVHESSVTIEAHRAGKKAERKP